MCLFINALMPITSTYILSKNIFGSLRQSECALLQDLQWSYAHSFVPPLMSMSLCSKRDIGAFTRGNSDSLLQIAKNLP